MENDKKEHPILFNTDMVKAILDGRKTQTRRVIKPQPEMVDKEPKFMKNTWAFWDFSGGIPKYRDGLIVEKSPYGKVGDRLWVRETWLEEKNDLKLGDTIITPKGIYYKADPPHHECPIWKPSIHMFRKDSRITLEIIDIRVERVQDITINDCKSEDMTCDCLQNIEDRCLIGNREHFKSLWNSINEKRGYGWDKNPWVWVVEFKIIGGGK